MNVYRFGGTAPFNAGPACWADGEMLKSESNVCESGLQEKLYDWQSINNFTNDFGMSDYADFSTVIERSLTGGTAYGDYGPTVELSTWTANYETFVPSFGGSENLPADNKMESIFINLLPSSFCT